MGSNILSEEEICEMLGVINDEPTEDLYDKLVNNTYYHFLKMIFISIEERNRSFGYSNKLKDILDTGIDYYFCRYVTYTDGPNLDNIFKDEIDIGHVVMAGLPALHVRATGAINYTEVIPSFHVNRDCFVPKDGLKAFNSFLLDPTLLNLVVDEDKLLKERSECNTALAVALRSVIKGGLKDLKEDLLLDRATKIVASMAYVAPDLLKYVSVVRNDNEDGITTSISLRFTQELMVTINIDVDYLNGYCKIRGINDYSGLDCKIEYFTDLMAVFRVMDKLLVFVDEVSKLKLNKECSGNVHELLRKYGGRLNITKREHMDYLSKFISNEDKYLIYDSYFKHLHPLENDNITFKEAMKRLGDFIIVSIYNNFKRNS